MQFLQMRRHFVIFLKCLRNASIFNLLQWVGWGGLGKSGSGEMFCQLDQWLVCRLIYDLGLGKRFSNRVRCCVEMDFMNRGLVEEV
jgi:hypothetical protein